MAIKTQWMIDYKCGHSQERDLSDRAPDKRAGYASWLTKTECFECYKKSNAGEDVKRREMERAERLEAVAVYEKRSGLEQLSGSEKQISWAREVRARVLSSLYESVESGEKDESWFEDVVLKPAQLIATARWWIDNREFEGEDWPELLAAGAQSSDANENVTA